MLLAVNGVVRRSTVDIIPQGITLGLASMVQRRKERERSREAADGVTKRSPAGANGTRAAYSRAPL